MEKIEIFHTWTKTLLSSRAFVNVDDDNDDDDNEDDDDNDNDDDDDDHVDSNSGFDGDFKFPKFLEKKVMKAKNVAPDLEGRGVRKQVNLFTMYPKSEFWANLKEAASTRLRKPLQTLEKILDETIFMAIFYFHGHLL